LEKADEWIRAAIAGDERPQRYFPDGTEADRYHTSAMCQWLRGETIDAETLRLYLMFEDRYFKGLSGRDRTEISFGVPGYVSAQAYSRVVEICENVLNYSPQSFGLRIQTEAQMSYVIARHRMGMAYSAEDATSATRRFLDRNVDRWLGDGHSVRCAEWMKIAYCDSGECESPRQAILRCYEHVP
jgi:hypothetical protein